jgi:phosphate transport system permease protein
MTDIPETDATSDSRKTGGRGNGKFRSRRLHLFGLDSDDLVKAFFGGNATLAIVVLVLIMVFLFKEGAGFFGQNAREMDLYRKSGLECADYMRRQVDDFYSLSRYLTSVESEALTTYTKVDGLPFKEAREKTAALHTYTETLRKSAAPLKKLADANVSACVKARNKHRLDSGSDLAAVRAAILDSRTKFYELNEELRATVATVRLNLPSEDERFAKKLHNFQSLAERYIDESRDADKLVAKWNPDKPVGWLTSITTFLFGSDWVTNSFYQDWYGVLPLLSGSLLVSFIALVIAVPLGVAGAIYVNQFANKKEQMLIKPYIEFISAIPSVVIGFFGVIVWGQFVRDASQWEWLSWVPGFPISERLNAFTAGCLLALMAIPTIFTLAEDAINNVPKAYTEASFAVGSTRLQTTARIIVPTAMSGIISAVLLGFGRVIGETMVVLLCAGNRIEMPALSDGLAAFFKPVHTMTGIVAQEMGEVVPGSIHYRALFLVGTLLFFISLLINYLAQKIMRRYSISER